MNNNKAKKERTLQSVQRGMLALEIAAANPDGLALKEFAACMRVKPPTAHILLNTLILSGHLQRTPDRRYRLGEAIFRLADIYMEHTMRRGAADIMRSVSAKLPRATIIFAEQRSWETAVLLRIAPERPGLVESPRARYMGPYNSATALACQSCWNREERLEYRRHHDFNELGINLWGSLDNLDDFLDQAGTLGYAMPVFKDSAIRSIAAPVFNQRGQLTATLGVSMPAQDFGFQEPDIINIVEKAARKLKS
ncbi:MAG: IclR family transcriptional regulator [Kiritimatiellia bacterium]|nr:hypothetical protein [Lentisphaerota bacterium]